MSGCFGHVWLLFDGAGFLSEFVSQNTQPASTTTSGQRDGLSRDGPDANGAALVVGRSDAVLSPSKLVILKVATPDRFFLAEERNSRCSSSFSPTVFCDAWSSRPFHDYSAALQPLVALAVVTIGIRVHQMRDERHLFPAAFLDPTCGTGTLAAAALFCGGSSFRVLAGDVSDKMAVRARKNLQTCFPQQLPDPSPEDVPVCVRQWDATHPWPLPALPGVQARCTVCLALILL